MCSFLEVKPRRLWRKHRTWVNMICVIRNNISLVRRGRKEERREREAREDRTREDRGRGRLQENISVLAGSSFSLPRFSLPRSFWLSSLSTACHAAKTTYSLLTNSSNETTAPSATILNGSKQPFTEKFIFSTFCPSKGKIVQYKWA